MTKKLRNLKPLFNTTTTTTHTNSNNIHTLTKNKTTRRNIMTTKTKTVTQTVPPKSTIKKCFICSGPINVAPNQKRTRKIKPSIPCKPSNNFLYIQEPQEALGKCRRTKIRVTNGKNQKALPTNDFTDTTKVLGY